MARFHLFCRALPTHSCKRPYNIGRLEEVHLETHCLGWITVQSSANWVARLLTFLNLSLPSCEVQPNRVIMILGMREHEYSTKKTVNL